VPIISMRQVIVLCAMVAAVVLGSVAWTWGPWILGKKISAGAIQFSPDGLSGSFKISRSFSKNAIPSDGTGGGCLVADLNDFHFPKMPIEAPNRKCSRNSDCQAIPAGWAGYCNQEEGRCWVRPGPGGEHLCNKSPISALTVGTTYESNKPFDLSAPYYPHALPDGSVWLRSFSESYPRSVRWRVLACLNGIHPETGETKYTNAKGEDTRGCGEVDSEYRMEVFGPIATVPPDASVPPAPKGWPTDVAPGPNPK
jgi:hypothetical protein